MDLLLSALAFLLGSDSCYKPIHNSHLFHFESMALFGSLRSGCFIRVHEIQREGKFGSINILGEGSTVVTRCALQIVHF
jgi:hypothetical protein